MTYFCLRQRFPVHHLSYVIELVPLVVFAPLIPLHCTDLWEEGAGGAVPCRLLLPCSTGGLGASYCFCPSLGFLPTLGFGSWSGIVYFGKTNKRQDCQANQCLVSVSAPSLPAVACGGERMRPTCLEPAVWKVGTEELPGSLDMSYMLLLGAAGDCFGECVVPHPQRWHWEARFSSGTLVSCCPDVGLIFLLPPSGRECHFLNIESSLGL